MTIGSGFFLVMVLIRTLALELAACFCGLLFAFGFVGDNLCDLSASGGCGWPYF